MRTRRSADRPSRRKRVSSCECCKSGPSSASPSRNTVTASSNETPCFAALASAFRGSHSNTYLVYTECRMRPGAEHPFPAPSKCVKKNRGAAATPHGVRSAPGAGFRRSLCLHNGSKNRVDFGVREANREDSVTASKVARISSLRQKRASLENFPNCRDEAATPGASTIRLAALRAARSWQVATRRPRAARSWQAASSDGTANGALSEARRAESKGRVEGLAANLPRTSSNLECPSVYIVKCADGSLYVGSTSDVESRVQRHNDGFGCHYTASRRPVALAYSDELRTLPDALRREKQVKRWTAAKKQALIDDRLVDVKALSQRRRRPRNA